MVLSRGTRETGSLSLMVVPFRCGYFWELFCPRNKKGKRRSCATNGKMIKIFPRQCKKIMDNSLFYFFIYGWKVRASSTACGMRLRSWGPVPPGDRADQVYRPAAAGIPFMGFCGYSQEKAIPGRGAVPGAVRPIGKLKTPPRREWRSCSGVCRSGGYVLALSSSKPEEMCRPICEKFGFSPDP